MLVTGTSKRWRFRYLISGKERIITLGEYPSVSLAAARRTRDDYLEMLSEGIDPGEQRRAKKARLAEGGENSFGAIAKQWHDTNAEKWTARYSEQIWRRIRADLAGLWSRPIAEISAHELLTELRKAEDRGVRETTRRLRQYADQIFRFAISEDLTNFNPAPNLRGRLKPPPRPVHHKAMSPGELGEFLWKLDDYDGERTTILALKLVILTALRTAEVREATWSEIENLHSYQTARWKIGEERMKANQPHVVPLSRQAVDVLRELKDLTGDGDYLFPGLRGRPMSTNTLIFALYRMGYRSRATTHGFRATFSTMCNEAQKSADLIELSLAHTHPNRTRSAYAHHELMRERRELFQWYADRLDRLKATARLLG